MQRLLFIGPRPPPITGYANIVHSLARYLMKARVKVSYISTTPAFATSFFPGKFWKILRGIYFVFISLITISLIPFHTILYLNINGGFGQVFDCFLVFWSRLFGKKIVIHHNSFSYLTKTKLLPGLLFSLAGSRSYHIVNCSEMRDALISKYPQVNNVKIVSNASILLAENPNYFDIERDLLMDGAANLDEQQIVVGFMGYFNKDKGLDVFCLTIKKLIESGVKVKGIAVGPNFDVNLTNQLKLDFDGIIDFCRPVYGLDRDKFFHNIDFLLFPSHYATEAEPLTIHHALSMGVPVVSTDIGCLKNVLNKFKFCQSYSCANFVSEASEFIINSISKDRGEMLMRKRYLIESYKNISIGGVKSFNSELRKIGVL